MRLRFFLSIYILSVFVFSFVYYVIYLWNSTSFIIEKQYNQNTINVVKLWDYLDDSEDIELNFPEDIYDFNKSIARISSLIFFRESNSLFLYNGINFSIKMNILSISSSKSRIY